MERSNKIGKFLSAVVLAAVFISVISTEVSADSKLSLNTKEQSHILEQKRISQSIILGEKQKNTNVEGMLSSKDIDDKVISEIDKDEEIKGKK